jgi:N-acetylmuramoyl-L-alanine amidase
MERMKSMSHKYIQQLMRIFLVWAMMANAMTPWAAYAESKAVIEVNLLNVRKGPGLDYPVVAQVKQGESYSVLKVEKRWVEIKLSTGETGWVADWLITRQKQKTELVSSNVASLNIRSGPSTSFPVIQQMGKNDAYPLVRKEGDWVQIQLADNLMGWVASWLTQTHQRDEDTRQASSPSISQVEITAKVLNLRKGPSTNDARIGQLSKGDVVTVLNVQNDWYKVELSGESGWIAGWHAKPVQGGSGASGRTSATEGPQVKIINPGTNLRTGPGLDFNVVDRGEEGDTFPILGTEGRWYKIKLEDGNPAYVAGWIVATIGMNPIVDPKINSYLEGKTIVIDPGHGGIDNGATGSHFDTLEKVLNLKVSKILEAKLEAAGAKVILTRTQDKKIPLETRVYLSHRHKADAFISVHHNTNANSRISGIITYYYSGNQDRKLANIVQKELIKKTGLRDLKARKGDYYVLRENAQLAILCELGFLTNYQDEFKLRTDKYQENGAEGIFQGLLLYFKDQEKVKLEETKKEE